MHPATWPHHDARLRLAIAATLTLLTLLLPRLLHAQDWRTVTSSRSRSGEETLQVTVEYAAGQLRLGTAPAGMLYRTSMRYDAGAFTPRVAYANNRLKVDLEGQNVRGRNLKSGHFDLKLGGDVPIELDLAFGAADATLDLGGLRIRRAKVQTGASRTLLDVSSLNPERCTLLEVQVGAARFEARRLGNLNAERISIEGGVGEIVLDFTGDWQTSLDARVQMGLGSLTLRVPRGLGVRIAKEGLLAAFDSEGLIKRGDEYYSVDWDRADHKLSLELSASLGSIRVEWVDS